MTCELELLDCMTIAEAGLEIELRISNINDEIKKFTKEYGKEDILTVSAEKRSSYATDARKKLLNLGNKCGCNIDVKTGMTK